MVYNSSRQGREIKQMMTNNWSTNLISDILTATDVAYLLHALISIVIAFFKFDGIFQYFKFFIWWWWLRACIWPGNGENDEGADFHFFMWNRFWSKSDHKPKIDLHQHSLLSFGGKLVRQGGRISCNLCALREQLLLILVAKANGKAAMLRVSHAIFLSLSDV